MMKALVIERAKGIYICDQKSKAPERLSLLCHSPSMIIKNRIIKLYQASRVMDVELQILKHLAREAQPAARIIDEYCAEYKTLFKEVINYECFKYLQLGDILAIKRKLLP